MQDLGECIKALREKRNWTQEQLAKKSGVTKSAISSYELGARKPSCMVLRDFARVFHVSADYLLGIDARRTVELDGLSEDDERLIRELVASLSNK